MKFSLSPKELNNWKAGITERLLECYFEQVLASRLKKEENWDFIILVSCTWFSVPNSIGFNPDFKNEKVFFLSNGLIPTPRLFISFKKLTQTLSNLPDGFLVKLKKTGNSKCLENGILEMDAKFLSHSFGKMETRFKKVSAEKNAQILRERGYAIEETLSFEIGLWILGLVIGFILGWLTNLYFYRKQRKETEAYAEFLKQIRQYVGAKISLGNDKRGKIIENPDKTIAIRWTRDISSDAELTHSVTQTN